MSQIIGYVSAMPHELFCDKKGLHAGEVINLVCLDPLCRNNPLGCCVCFSQTHKYHKVVTLSKFLSDYGRTVQKQDRRHILHHINTIRQEVTDILASLRRQFEKSLTTFEQDIAKYADMLIESVDYSKKLASELSLILQPQQLRRATNLSDIRKSVNFILDNSQFDTDNNMLNIPQLMKSNSDRILGLVSELHSLTVQSARSIDQSLHKLSFVKSSKGDMIKSKNRSAESIDYDALEWPDKNLESTIAGQMSAFKDTETPITRFMFTTLKSKHLQSHNSMVRSSVNCARPEYALAEPHVQTMPGQIKRWAVKINRCRNEGFKNTLAVGLARRRDLENSGFRQQSKLKQCYLIDSTGKVTTPDSEYVNANFRFSEGDALYFKYDPYYGLVEIKNTGGQVLSLRVKNDPSNPLHVCVRLTYASDEVQVLTDEALGL